MEKPWKVILAFAGVFVAGAIFGGALAPRWFGPRRPMHRGQAFELHLMDRLTRELALTPEQQKKIAPIVSRAEAETRRLRRESVQSFRAVMEKANTEIAAELTPEQRTKMDEMQRRFRERLERFRARHGQKRAPPPPPPDQGR